MSTAVAGAGVGQWPLARDSCCAGVAMQGPSWGGHVQCTRLQRPHLCSGWGAHIKHMCEALSPYSTAPSQSLVCGPPQESSCPPPPPRLPAPAAGEPRPLPPPLALSSPTCCLPRALGQGPHLGPCWGPCHRAQRSEQRKSECTGEGRGARRAGWTPSERRLLAPPLGGQSLGPGSRGAEAGVPPRPPTPSLRAALHSQTRGHSEDPLSWRQTDRTPSLARSAPPQGGRPAGGSVAAGGGQGRPRRALGE